jgi:hypothetical protein
MSAPERDTEEYRKNADVLIRARTEQLRNAVSTIEKLVEAMRAAINAPNLDTARDVLRTAVAEVPQPSKPPQFGGEPGTPVPEVDAEDVKAVRRQYLEIEQDHPGRQVAIGMELLKNVCKPGANIEAVYYRHAQLHVLKIIAEQNVIPKLSLDTITTNGDFKDSAFEAISKVPMQWMGDVPMQGLPFDLERFLQLCTA